LNRYRLLERLGAGGFGVVWRAQDQALQREVAIKRVLCDGDNETGGNRAHREAVATARLAHPAIASLYEARAEGDWLYLISELVIGESLDKLMRARAVTDEAALQMGVAINAALQHAHDRGVIHRDVKPANVVVLTAREAAREQVPAKLTDFGSARVSGDEGLTRTGDVLGTLAYMAPEQSEGYEATAQTDLYALALTLYEALAGVNPLRGPTPAATARRLGGTVPALEHARGDLPRGLTRAVDRALSPEPEQRGSLDDLRVSLQQTLAPGREGQTRRLPGRGRRALAHVVRTPPQLPPPTPDLAPTHTPALAPRQATRIRLPRLLWWAAPLALIASQALSGHAGVALVLGAMALPLLALPRRSGPGWLAGALAPLLGLVGLAGAFPALAGQASRWKVRAALGALGYWWLMLATPLVGRRLWLWPYTHGHAVAVSAWRDSVGHAVKLVLKPLLVAGTLEGAALWAIAALLLPVVVRGRSAARDLVAATVWAAALASAAPLLDSGVEALSHPSPRGLVLGAVLGGAVAVAARATRGNV
jgi:hypothetical protein